MTAQTSVLAVGAVVVACLSLGSGCRGERPEGGETKAGHAEATRTPEEGREGVVLLSEASLARAGLVTAVLHVARHGVLVQLTGELIPDSGRIVTIRAPVSGRLMAVDSATWPALGEQVEAARVLARVSDALPLSAPRGGTVTRIGALPGELVQAGQALLEISDFNQPLARVVWRPDAPPSPPSTLVLSPLTGARVAVEARLMGAAPEADPLSRASVYLYRAERAWLGARPGVAIEARFPDPRAQAHGVLVPADAVVQWEGLAWVYLQHGVGRFVRTQIETDTPVEGGYVLQSGVSAGDTVVVRGAQQLLSEEFRSRTTGGEAGEPDEH